MAQTAVYLLMEPFTDEVRYVGVSRKPMVRLSRHMGSGHLDDPVAVWLRSLRPRCPGFKVLGWFDEDKALVVEAQLIDKLARSGANLCNVQHNGGKDDESV